MKKLWTNKFCTKEMKRSMKWKKNYLKGKSVLKLYSFSKVLWKGYSIDQCTWEPIENLKNCIFLKKYQKKVNLKDIKNIKVIEYERM